MVQVLEECMKSNSETASDLHGICSDLIAAKMLTEKSFEEQRAPSGAIRSI
jgi:hypothetical protein